MYLPPDGPAVSRFRRMNRRLGDIFAKKNSAYIFHKSKKYKNKKNSAVVRVVMGRAPTGRVPPRRVSTGTAPRCRCRVPTSSLNLLKYIKFLNL